MNRGEKGCERVVLCTATFGAMIRNFRLSSATTLYLPSRSYSGHSTLDPTGARLVRHCDLPGHLRTSSLEADQLKHSTMMMALKFLLVRAHESESRQLKLGRRFRRESPGVWHNTPVKYVKFPRRTAQVPLERQMSRFCERM
jgi:hypothetical protein